MHCQSTIVSWLSNKQVRNDQGCAWGVAEVDTTICNVIVTLRSIHKVLEPRIFFIC